LEREEKKDRALDAGNVYTARRPHARKGWRQKECRRIFEQQSLGGGECRTTFTKVKRGGAALAHSRGKKRVARLQKRRRKREDQEGQPCGKKKIEKPTLAYGKKKIAIPCTRHSEDPANQQKRKAECSGKKKKENLLAFRPAPQRRRDHYLLNIKARQPKQQFPRTLLKEKKGRAHDRPRYSCGRGFTKRKKKRAARRRYTSMGELKYRPHGERKKETQGERKKRKHIEYSSMHERGRAKKKKKKRVFLLGTKERRDHRMQRGCKKGGI